MKWRLYKLFFHALSNNTRFEIIQLLRDKPKCVKEICEELSLEQSRISHNLRCLENCGFVLFEWKGKYKIYSLDKEYIIPLLKIIEQHIEKYSERLINCGIIKEGNQDEDKETLNYEI